ncbi:hypothetical protein AQUCO_01400747v1, partial [Aquilegia coerulea]
CISFFLYLLCLVAVGSSHARQEDALTRLFNAKAKGMAEIDTSFYDELRIINESKVLSQEGLKEKDKIEKLPGQPYVEFSQYGGYVTVDEKAGRAFYYYFTEAEHSKESKPLLLWLNGGPGCSSLAYGAMQELGPFRVTSDGKKLYHNPYAWNKAGVGFSYSNTTSDYKLSGDRMTAEDNYVFLANWLQRFPEYKDRDFYISGESYAGHYVPQLAHTILHHNKLAKKTIINLKGIIIGNAVINDITDNIGMYDYFWTHALISDESRHNIGKYCDFSPNGTTQSKECLNALNEAGANVGPIDIYNIYAPICSSSNLTATPKKASLIIDPCSDYFTYAYLNTPEVQKALHANVTGSLNYTWEPCSNIIPTWGDSPSTILPLLEEFMANGLRVWVFSGDTDGRVPVTGTRYSLNKLNLPTKAKFYPWAIEGEVGGYSIVYQGDLTFATVRGAGHQVPSYQPLRALTLIKNFLDGTLLPKAQKDALHRLYNAKLNVNAEIDTNFYSEVEIIEEFKVLPQEGLKEKDRIEKLPGQPNVDFTQYGGYVTVDEKAGRAFYYYFTEAEHNKQAKPLILWLNGGPGCSSIAYGAMEELGPFRANSDGKTLFKNPYAWNKVANVLFVESPAGVGFSYSNTTRENSNGGDKKTAADNYVFLVNWLERFSEYKDRDFYLAGESYAGHYVPQLAHTILEHNKRANKTIINLKGIMIGNAAINDFTDTIGMYDYFWTHALISDELINNIHKNCNSTQNTISSPTKECQTLMTEAEKIWNQPLDIYNIYGPICLSSNLTEKPTKQLTTIDPCSDTYVSAYLNTPEVLEALHVNVNLIVNHTWQPCINGILNWTDAPRTVLPLLREFIANGLRVWVFSGDTDGRVPVTSTRYTLNKLKLPVKAAFYPWSHKGEVGGYSIVYDGLTFATVRGAGHEVPSFQPSRALALIKNFLDGTPLPRAHLIIWFFH